MRKYELKENKFGKYFIKNHQYYYLDQFEVYGLDTSLWYDKIDVWFEVARNEVITAIEDIYNDELYKGYEEKITNISEEDINRIAWKIEDYNVWDDVYEYARQEILEKIEVED